MANLAIRRLVRGADGSARIIFVDLVTFLPVHDLTGYTVVDQGIELQEEPVEDVKQPDKEAPPEEKGPSPYDSKGERPEGASSRFGTPVPTAKSIIADARKTTSPLAPNQKPTVVNPTRESTVVNPVQETPTEVARVDDSLGSVKMTQGSVLPDLKQERFSPPTAESIAAQAVQDSSPVSPVTNGTGAVNPTKETGLAPNKESTTPTGVGFAAPNRPGVPGTPTDVEGYNANYGPKRPNPVDNSFAAGVVAAAQKVSPGATVEGYSGQGEYGSARHRDKRGVAMDARAYNPDGSIFSPDQTRDLASQYAYSKPGAGIGYGKTYMGENEVHLDDSGLGAQWGAGNARANLQRDDMTLDQTIDAARAGFRPTPFANAPTPTARPASVPTMADDPSYAPDTRATAYGAVSPTKTTAPDTSVADSGSVFGKMVDGVGTVAGQIKDQAKQTSNNRQRVDPSAIGTMSPAQYGVSLGTLSNRTPAQNNLIDKAIAGELSGNTLRALAKNDPDAMKEYANVATSIENRVASKMFGSLEKTLVGSQYNSLMDSKKAVTNANMKEFGPSLAKAREAYQAGEISPTDWGISSYYNADISAPSWGLGMTNAAKTGYHTFGSLSEYGPSASFKAERDRVSRDVKGAEQSYSGVNGGGDLDSPSEKSGIGRGSGLGSRKSDSKSQAGSGGTSRGQSRGASGSRSQPGSGGTSRGSKSTSSKGQPGSGGSSRGSSKSAGSQPGSGGIGRGSASKSAKAEKSKAEKTDKSGSEGRR